MRYVSLQLCKIVKYKEIAWSVGKEREEVACTSPTTSYPYTVGYHMMSYSTTTSQSAHNQMANKIGQVTITVHIFHIIGDLISAMMKTDPRK